MSGTCSRALCLRPPRPAPFSTTTFLGSYTSVGRQNFCFQFFKGNEFGGRAEDTGRTRNCPYGPLAGAQGRVRCGGDAHRGTPRCARRREVCPRPAFTHAHAGMHTRARTRTRARGAIGAGGVRAGVSVSLGWPHSPAPATVASPWVLRPPRWWEPAASRPNGTFLAADVEVTECHVTTGRGEALIPSQTAVSAALETAGAVARGRPCSGGPPEPASVAPRLPESFGAAGRAPRFPTARARAVAR